MLDKELTESVPQQDKLAGNADVPQEKPVMMLITVMKNPFTWAVAAVCAVGYALYSLQGYFTPYLTAVVGASPEESVIFAIIRTYVFFTLAPIGGILADKVFGSTARWIGTAFTFMIAVVAGFFLIPEGANSMIVGFYTLLPSAFVQMTYTIKYSVINEIQISPGLIATTTGVLSTVGSLMDMALSPFVGWCLDTQGNNAYTTIFILLMVLLAIGAFCAFAIARANKKALGKRI